MSESSLCLTRRTSPGAPLSWLSKWSALKWLGWCGGDPGGGLGTSVEAIMKAIEQAWSERGVAILVDLGGAETNSEMAIEMLPEERRGRVVVCNAPVVEGAVMAATEAASGATLEAVRRTAEELTPV